MARETSENSTYLYRTSVQYRCKWILYKLALFGRPKRLGYDENDRGCRNDSPMDSSGDARELVSSLWSAHPIMSVCLQG